MYQNTEYSDFKMEESKIPNVLNYWPTFYLKNIEFSTFIRFEILIEKLYFDTII